MIQHLIQHFYRILFWLAVAGACSIISKLLNLQPILIRRLSRSDPYPTAEEARKLGTRDEDLPS